VLSQAVLASYEKPESDGIHGGQLTVTGISPCPYGTYLNYKHLDPQETGPADRLRMQDGHWQEMQVVENLRHAGFQMRFTGSNQMTLHVGRIPVTGRPDGLIVVDGREDVLEVKAMSLNRFTNFKAVGLEKEPLIKCQEQLYLASEEFRDSKQGTWIYAKHKDTCRPYDLFEPKDLSYSEPIIEATEEIVLGNWEPSFGKCPLCTRCRHRLFCWKEDFILDTSGTKVAGLPEVAEKWREGKFYKDYGKLLVEEARVVFEEYLGDDELLLAEDLRVRRIFQHRSQISTSKFVEKFGAAALADVMEETIVPQIRISEVEY